MARYKGVVTQSTLDWYAGKASAAQQWFSQAAANYWAFTLQNNSVDGTRLWIYDAESVSGAAFPAGTGNPAGNPIPIAGYQGGTSSPGSFLFVSNSHTIQDPGAQTSITVTAPASLAVGNVIIGTLICQNETAAKMFAPDATWIRIGGADGSAGHPGMAVFIHTVTGGEPANYVFTCTDGQAAMGIELVQFSGNVNPAVADAVLVQGTDVTTLAPTAPAVFTNAPGDLVYCIYALNNPGPTMGAFAGLTNFAFFSSNPLQAKDAYKLVVNQGSVGPFVASLDIASGYTVAIVTLKASNPGAAPAQALAAPIASVTPLSPGIFSLNFSSQAIALSGITRWVPPASHFEWHREAPLAIIAPNTNFNLAGISPEFAAWGSLTWLAIK